jgi:hypothetical protein
MNTKTVMLAIVITIAATTLILAPSLSHNALAVKREKTTCPSGNECQGKSGEHNPNAKCTVVAGSKEHQVDQKTC